LKHGQADRLDRELPKNGDVPNSPLTEKWQPGAVGRHNFKLKIEVGSYHRCHWRRFSHPISGRGTAMKFQRRQFLRLAAGAAALPAVARMARAQTYPVRPVTLVVPFSAGGITDVVARLTAGQLQTSLKQPFLVENQPGGAGILAANRVAKAAPDGYLLLFTPIFQITMAPFTHTVTFDPIKDFMPIASVAASPFVITVGNPFPANTLADFIAYVKAKPSQLSFGSAGPGSFTHVSSAVFLKSAGLDMIHVPYRGVVPAFTDLLAGQVAMISASPVELKPYLESGKIKPLAVTSSERSKQLPNVPTVAETLKSPPVVTYNGLLAPRRTPVEIVEAIARALRNGVEFQDRLAQVGTDRPIRQYARRFREDNHR
jgi:tripartite-type tricarboxylate transporter receptor subunit TctC